MSQIIVRKAQGEKERSSILSDLLRNTLKTQLEKTKALHQLDLRNGYGTVYLPYALEWIILLVEIHFEKYH